MTLTHDQSKWLRIHGGRSLRELVDWGKLPRCPEVNARIAQRCYYENPRNWHVGEWFKAQWVGNNSLRRGPVNVRRDGTPGGIAYRIVSTNGRWCDSLSEKEAVYNLKAQRDSRGRIVYLNAEESYKADTDYHFALSR